MPKVLITGADGFIGASLVYYLGLFDGFRTVALDKKFNKRMSVPLYSHEQIKDDYRFLETHNIDDVDVIVHLGAHSLLGPSVSDPAEYYLNNVTGTLNILECLRHKNRMVPIIFASSAAVYAPTTDKITEKSTLAPPNPYGQTKLMTEKMLHDYHMAYGLNYMSLRFFNVVGVMGEVFSQMLRGPHILPSAFAAYQDRRPFMLAGSDFGTPDGTCIRDYVSIMTVCHAIKKLIEQIQTVSKVAESFNVSSGTGTSNMDIISIIARKVHRRFDYEYTSRRPGDPPYLVGDNSKLESYIGRLPQQPIDNIIADVYKYYKIRGIIND